MNDVEEAARKYAEENNIVISCDCNYYESRDDIKDAYIAGARSKGVVWHNLRKDAGKAPQIGSLVCIAFTHKRYELVTYLGDEFTSTHFGSTEYKPVAWCEIPKFETER